MPVVFYLINGGYLIMFNFLKKINSTALIGLDCGSHSVKAVGLSKYKGEIYVDGVVELPLNKGVIADNNLRNSEKLTSVIKQIIERFPPFYKKAAIAVTGTDVITKVVNVSAALSDRELKDQIEIESENIIPFPLDEVFWDFEVTRASSDNLESNNVLVSAARKDNVLLLIESVEAAGVEVTVVDIENHALIRACQKSLTASDHEHGIAVLDIGASHMNFNILSQREIIFSRVKAHGGDVCSQLFSERYNIDFFEAEKRKVSGDWPLNCVLDVIDPFIKMTLEQLQLDLRMFVNEPNHVDVTKVILTGGCLLLPNLRQEIATSLGIDTEFCGAFSDLKCRRNEDFLLLCKDSIKYVTALGLAMRGVN